MVSKSMRSTFILLFLFCLFIYPFFEYRWNLQAIDKSQSTAEDMLSINIIERNSNVHILLCSDEANRLPMYVLINSIIAHEPNPKRLHFHILVYENIALFEKEIKLYFDQYLNEIFIEFKSMKNDHPECIEYNEIASKQIYKKLLNHPMNFARFCLPDIFNEVRFGIYLDVDMIATDRISKLFDDDSMRDYVAQSVMNRDAMRITRSSFADLEQVQFINDWLNNALHSEYPSVASQPINLTQLGSWFNAGILIFDLEIWRKCKFMQQSLELFKFDKKFKRKFHRRPWYGVTQPIMNMLFVINQMEVGQLDKQWNVVVTDKVKQCRIGNGTHAWDKYAKKFKGAKIIHFAGACKPWTESYAASTRLWIKYIPKNADIDEWQKEFNVTFIE